MLIQFNYIQLPPHNETPNAYHRKILVSIGYCLALQSRYPNPIQLNLTTFNQFTNTITPNLTKLSII